MSYDTNYKAQARALFECGWLPISNRFHLVGQYPVGMDIYKLLASKTSSWADSMVLEVKRWMKIGEADCRDHYARVYGPRQEVTNSVYFELKRLCGKNNRTKGPKVQ